MASGGGGGGGRSRGDRAVLSLLVDKPLDTELLLSTVCATESWLLLLVSTGDDSCSPLKALLEYGLPDVESNLVDCNPLPGMVTGAPVEADLLCDGGTKGGGILGRSACI